MKNQNLQFSFIVLIATFLTGCEPGFYEQKLNSKIDDHLDKIRNLNESIANAESEIKSHQPLAFEAQPEVRSNYRTFFRVDERMDFLLLQKRCEVDKKWLESHNDVTGEDLLAAIEFDEKIKLETLACIRFPADHFQFSESVSNSNRRFFVKPSTGEDRNRSSQQFRDAFGYPLDQLILTRSFVVVPDGNTLRINAAFDSDQKVVQLEISHNRFSNPALEKIPFRDRTNSPSPELFAMAIPAPKASTHQTHTVRVPISQWLISSTLPLSNNPNRVTLHFLKAIEVN